MTAEEYLSKIRKIVKMIRNKKAERDMLYDLATSTTKQISADRVQSSGNPQKMADAVCKKIGLDEAISKMICELEKEFSEVIETIEKLPAVHYDVLHLMYIQGKSADDVASMYNKSLRWALSKRSDAIRRLQRILDSKDE